MFDNMKIIIDSNGKEVRIEKCDDDDIIFIDGQAYMKLENLEEDED